MNVTRAVLPVMREQRSGHVITISSSAGFAGFEYGTAYAASKFGVDGWMESLAPEIEPFGIHATVVNPGFFRTELLTQESTNYAPASIEDYAERNAAQREFWEGMNGKQGGDPAKLAQALLTLAGEPQPPFRFIAGADAIAQAEDKLAERQRQIDAYRDLSTSLALDARPDFIMTPAYDFDGQVALVTAAGHQAIAVPCDVADETGRRHGRAHRRDLRPPGHGLQQRRHRRLHARAADRPPRTRRRDRRHRPLARKPRRSAFVLGVALQVDGGFVAH